MQSSAIPLLASRQGGVSASSRKFREATEADADGVVFLLFLSENHPVLSFEAARLRACAPRRSADASRYFLDRSATPPCRDARRGVTLDCNLFTAPLGRDYILKL